ncbi:hypothetical protein ABZ714_34300 [Streptomyces sp. NPDC006798]|uniref:hypothetical protein n=1 Tax=unclassified Streptomyces TaxID=2593676 RepID=UPI00331B6013
MSTPTSAPTVLPVSVPSPERRAYGRALTLLETVLETSPVVPTSVEVSVAHGAPKVYFRFPSDPDAVAVFAAEWGLAVMSEVSESGDVHTTASGSVLGVALEAWALVTPAAEGGDGS